MIRISLITFALIFTIQVVHGGQLKSPEYIDFLNDESIRLIAVNNDSSLLLAEKAKDLSLSANYSFGLGEANFILGYHEDIKGKRDKAAILYFESIRYLAEIESQESGNYQVWNYSNIGRIFHDHHQFEQAIIYFNEGIKVAERFGANKDLAKLHYLKGRTFKNLDNFEEALNSLFNASKIAEDIDDFKQLAEINHQLGLIFKNIADYEKARDHYFKIFTFQDKLKNYSFHAGRACHNIAHTYKEESNLLKTEEYLILAIEYKKSTTNRASLFYSYLDLAEIYLESLKLNNAQLVYDSALALNIKLEDDPDEFKIYKQLSTLYGHIGDPEKFTEYNAKYTECLENYLQTSEELAQMDQQYNIQLVTQRYFELVENQKRMAALKKYGGFAAAGLLSIILLYLMISRIRKTRLKKSLEQELKDAMTGLDFDL